MQPSLGLGWGDPAPVDLALRDTIRTFTSPAAPTGQTTLISEIPSDVLSSDQSGTRIGRGSAATAHLSVTAQTQLTPIARVRAVLSVSQGHSRYRLPDGAGILTDPILLRFSSYGLTADAEMAVSGFYSRPIGTEIVVGGGLTIVRTQVRVNSALLNVRGTGTHSARFLTLGLDQPLTNRHLRAVAPDPRLELRARYFGKDYAAYWLGLRTRF